MNLDQFIATNTGKTIGNTAQNTGQCVGVPAVWFDICGTSHVWGDAKDLYANAGADYTKGTAWPAPKGAAIVLDYRWGGGAGHTGISLGDGRIFEQNNPTGSKPHVSVYSKPTGYIGFIMPKVTGADMATKEQLIELYLLAFPGQAVNNDWVTAFTGRDMSDALQNLRDDASRKSFVAGLLAPKTGDAVIQKAIDLLNSLKS